VSYKYTETALPQKGRFFKERLSTISQPDEIIRVHQRVSYPMIFTTTAFGFIIANFLSATSIDTESDSETYLDKLSDENLNQILESMPSEVTILCLCGLFLYSLAFGYKVGRNYKR
jgi:hypothetical protein